MFRKDESLMFPWNFFPNNDEIKKKINQMKPEEIEKFTHSMMTKIMPKQLHGMVNPQDMFSGFFPENENPPPSSYSDNSLNSTVFETHEHVYVRIRIESEEWLKAIKIYHTANLLIIEKVPFYENKHTITLPAVVKKKGATTRYKDGTLEIKIPKTIDMQFTEIDVSDYIDK